MSNHKIKYKIIFINYFTHYIKNTEINRILIDFVCKYALQLV